ncbi:MAG: flagellar hook-associated protein [Rhodocyclales bacterium GT-UBC]|nr:MAG: flagellar hook-associated protein [Rhodocyclales bacterium GT-UBC]
MATITSLGTGSGLELESLVTKLMTAESVSLTTLQKKQATYTTKISAMGTLRSSLASLQSAASALVPSALESNTDKYASYTATLANTTVGTATASTGAVAGKYSLEVSSLAQGQRLTSSAFASSTTSITSSGGTITLDLGTLSGTTYTADSNRSYSLSLAAGATLSDLRNAINNANAGVTATIINGSGGSQLVLNGSEGTNNVIKLSSSDITGFNFNPATSGTQDWTQSQAAADAAFTLNGIAATSHSNTVTSALDGVTLNLAGTNVGAATTLTITQDLTTNSSKLLQSFVTSYNSAYATMSTLGAYNATTKVAGDLQGNSTLRFAMNQMRQAVFTTKSDNATTPYQSLSDIGVSINTSGQLSIDTTKFNKAMNADPTNVTNLIVKVGSTYNSSIDTLIGTTGSVTVATNGLNKTVKDYDSRIEKLETQLASIEKRYRSQFSALDTLVSSLSKTGDYLTSFISSLSKSSS